MSLRKVIWNEKQIWDYLMKYINNAFGVAGLCGNICAESSYRSNNLQNTGNTRLGLSDDEYTNQVDNGTYSRDKFINDKFGYGLVQHTYFSRKQALYDYCKSKNASISDTETQLEFIIKELKDYKLFDDLQNATNIREASDVILLKFERPADQSEAVQIKRASYGEEFYLKYGQGEIKLPSTNKTDGKMTNLELVEKLKKLANTKTVYSLGCWGQPMSEDIISQKAKQLPNWYTEAKKNELRKYIGKAFGFDCVCMIKSILWGFNFDMNDKTGGARYKSNGVPDIGADSMIANGCSIVSTDFNNIPIGAVVWIQGHVGVCISNEQGKAQVIECTPKWKNGVQITNLGNVGNKTGNYRNWSKWGKLKYIDYIETEDKKEEVKPTAPTTSFKLGDVVMYKGNTHYSSSNSTSPKACKGGKATITSVYPKGKHPYHLVRVAGQGATVYGWVDAKDIEIITQKEEGKEESYRLHKVQSGESLWKIAETYFGKGQGKRYTEIMALNKDILKSTTIYTGQVLKIPNK